MVLSVAFVAVFGGILVGGLLVGLLVGFSYAGRLQHERRLLAQAEEKNARIPPLERDLAEARTQNSEMKERLATAERELFDKTTHMAELTVQLSNVRAQLAAKEEELDEEKRTSRARLAEQKRLSCERLERIHDAQMRVWDDFSHLIAEALAEEQPEYPRLVLTRRGADALDEIGEETESAEEAEQPPEAPAQDDTTAVSASADATETQTTPDEQDEEDPFAGIDLDAALAPDEDADYLDDQASEQTASPWLRTTEEPAVEEADDEPQPETIELTLFDEDEMEADAEDEELGDEPDEMKTPTDVAGEVAERTAEGTEASDSGDVSDEKKKPSTMLEDSTTWPQA